MNDLALLYQFSLIEANQCCSAAALANHTLCCPGKQERLSRISFQFEAKSNPKVYEVKLPALSVSVLNFCNTASHITHPSPVFTLFTAG
jgi:hypothetical protein